jgi:hypothetical protein
MDLQAVCGPGTTAAEAAGSLKGDDMALYFPVAGPRSYHDYHWDGRKSVDIFASKGTPIVAMNDGTVAIHRWPSGGEAAHLYTVINGIPVEVYNAHMVYNSGRAGKVYGGDVIGQVGDTGNAAGKPPHNHLCIATRERGVDSHGAGDIAPWPLLRAIERGELEGSEDMSRIAELESRLAQAASTVGALSHDVIYKARLLITDGLREGDQSKIEQAEELLRAHELGDS